MELIWFYLFIICISTICLPFWWTNLFVLQNIYAEFSWIVYYNIKSMAPVGVTNLVTWWGVRAPSIWTKNQSLKTILFPGGLSPQLAVLNTHQVPLSQIVSSSSKAFCLTLVFLQENIAIYCCRIKQVGFSPMPSSNAMFSFYLICISYT